MAQVAQFGQFGHVGKVVEVLEVLEGQASASLRSVGCHSAPRKYP